MRTSVAAIAAMFLFAGTTSWSQPQPPALDGKWTLRYATERGASREGRVVFQSGAGTWQVQATARDNPCLGKEFPIAVSDPHPEGFTLAVFGSKVLVGCPDSVYKLKRTGEAAFEGQFKDGRKFVLER